MTRRIVCPNCKSNWLKPSHPEDIAAGWQKRIVSLRAKKPEEHFMLVNGERHDLRSLVCDDCGTTIADGSDVFAVTMWQGDEPGEWEKDYTA